MKSSVSPALAVVAIVIAIAAAGFFAYRTLGKKSGASEDLTKNANLSALMNMTDQEKEKIRQDLLKAKESRDTISK